MKKTTLFQANGIRIDQKAGSENSAQPIKLAKGVNNYFINSLIIESLCKTVQWAWPGYLETVRWAWPGYLVHKITPWLVKCRAPWFTALPWLQVNDNSKTITEYYPERGPASFMCQSIRLCLPEPSASYPQMFSHFIYNFWCIYLFLIFPTKLLAPQRQK